MFRLLDGREEMYQWDLDLKLIVEDENIEQVHFCNRTDTCSLVCDTYKQDGLTLVNVPNILLQMDWRINVYGYDVNYTKYHKIFNVRTRTKPADYVYTETEIKTFYDLEERIDELAQEKQVYIATLETPFEDMAKALQEGQKLFLEVPDTDKYRANYALYPQLNVIYYSGEPIVITYSRFVGISDANNAIYTVYSFVADEHNYKDYIALEPKEQQAFFDSFEDALGYIAWYNAAKAVYDYNLHNSPDRHYGITTYEYPTVTQLNRHASRHKIGGGDAIKPADIGAVATGDEIVFIATYGETTLEELEAAYNKGKVIFCKDGNYTIPMYNYSSSSGMTFYRFTTTSRVNVYRSKNGWGRATVELCEDAIGDVEQQVTELNSKHTEELTAVYNELESNYYTKAQADTAITTAINEALGVIENGTY